MTKVEQVARALAISDGAKYEHNPATYNQLARVAIDAMREPSGKMKKAVVGNSGSKQFLAGAMYRAMIDAALEQ